MCYIYIMKNAKNMIEGMTKEAKKHYIFLMVKYNQITKSEAGHLLIEEGLI